MPTDREAMEFIKRGTAQGIPPDQLKTTLRKAGFAVGGEAYTPIAEPPPSGLPAEVEEMRAAGSKTATRQQEKEGIGMAAGALLGGLGGEATAARFIPRVAKEAPRIIRMLGGAARLAPEVAGEMAGTYGGGRLAGMSPEAAGEAAKFSAGTGLAGRTVAHIGTRVAGRAAGLRPETVQAGIDDPRILRAPEPDAELTQARRLNAQLESQRAEVTPYHRAYQEEFLGPSASRQVDLREYANMLRGQIKGEAHPASRAADRTLAAMADRLEGISQRAGRPVLIDLNTVEPSALPQSVDVPITGRIPTPERSSLPPDYLTGGVVQPELPTPPTISGSARTARTPPELDPSVAPDIQLPRAGSRVVTPGSGATPEELGGGQPATISLGDLDAWIRANLTDPLRGAYTKGSEAVLAERLMAARTAMSESLYERLGRGASSAQKLAGRAIKTREAVENVFDLGTEARPTGTAAERIKGILGDSGEAQKNRAVLAAYDEEYGTHHLADATRLAQSQEWQGKDFSKAIMIDSVLQPTRPTFVQSMALPVARGGARVTRVAGPATAAVTAGTQAEKRKKKEKR